MLKELVKGWEESKCSRQKEWQKGTELGKR